MDYIEPRIVTDPQEVAQLSFDYLQSRIAGWVPNDANLETILIEAHAQMTSEARDVASAVPTAIYRYLGGLFGVIPTDATYAQANVLFTAQDDSGYFVEAGTIVAYAATGSLLVPFLTLYDLTIFPGSTTGIVIAQAQQAGVAANELGTTGDHLQLLSTLSFLDPSGVILQETTHGGQDAESDDAYLDRLTQYLRLITPTPILPDDFSAMAKNIVGIWRAIAVDGYNPNANEIQSITVNGTGGTFAITFAGQTTGAIAYNASAATVKTALEALSNIAPGDVIVTGGPLATSPITVEFAGVYDGTNVATMTTNSASLTGGTHTATVGTIRTGSPRTDNERMIAIAGIDQNGDEVDPTTGAAMIAYLNALREIGFVVNLLHPTYTEVDISLTVVKTPNADSTQVHDDTVTALTSFLSPKNWGHDPAATDVLNDRSWTTNASNKVYVHDAAAIARSVAGVGHVDNITLGLHGGSLTDTDLTLPGVAPLPTPGTITVTVV